MLSAWWAPGTELCASLGAARGSRLPAQGPFPPTPDHGGLLGRTQLDGGHELRLRAQRSCSKCQPLPSPTAKKRAGKPPPATARPHPGTGTPSVTWTGAPSVPGHEGSRGSGAGDSSLHLPRGVPPSCAHSPHTLQPEPQQLKPPLPSGWKGGAGPELRASSPELHEKQKLCLWVPPGAGDRRAPGPCCHSESRHPGQRLDDGACSPPPPHLFPPGVQLAAHLPCTSHRARHTAPHTTPPPSFREEPHRPSHCRLKCDGDQVRGGLSPESESSRCRHCFLLGASSVFLGNGETYYVPGTVLNTPTADSNYLRERRDQMASYVTKAGWRTLTADRGRFVGSH